MKKLVFALGLALLSSGVFAQTSGNIPSGRVLGNPGATSAPASSSTLTAMFDRAFCSTANNALARIGGAWGCLPIQVAITPESVGAVCDNLTNNTTAFGALATAINSAQSAVVNFSRNCVYRVLPSITAGTSVTLMALTGLNSVTFNCNGSTIAVMDAFGTINTAAYVMTISNSNNITFNDCKFTQPNYTALDFQRGSHALNFDTTSNVVLNNITTTGGVAAVLCTRTPATARSNTWKITNLKTTNTYYALGTSRCPDNLTATGVTTVNAGRSYFPINVWNHYVQVLSDNGNGPQDIQIGSAYNALDTAYGSHLTQNIEVDYVNVTGPTGSGPNAFVNIQFGTDAGSAEGPATFDNIKLNVDINRIDTPAGPVLRITRGGVSTAQARVVSNVTLTGVYRSNATSPSVLELMTDSNWTGDLVQNLVIRNFTCAVFATGVMSVDGRGIVGPFRLENVQSNGSCTLTRTNMTTPGVQGLVDYKRVLLPNDIGTPYLERMTAISAPSAITGVNQFYLDSTSNQLTMMTGAGVTKSVGGVVSMTEQSFCPSGCTTTIAGGATGTYTPTVGMLYAEAECVGSGGGGGGSIGAVGQVYIGGGGGAGGYSRSIMTAAAVGASKSVVMGVAGTGTSGGSGSAGADVCITATSCVSGQIVAGKGGGAGQVSGPAAQGAGGVGGVAGTGTVKAAGAPGIGGLHNALNNTIYAPFGVGGSSFFGGGATGPALAGGATTTGVSAGAYGAGGGGAASFDIAANAAGGPGSVGACFVREYLDR